MSTTSSPREAHAMGRNGASLPRDYTRCLGLGCPDRLRLNCARHQDLPENTVLSWVRTMMIDGVPGCDGLIPWETGK